MQKEINSILEMIYWLYMKDLKAGNITKDKLISFYGKIIKKKTVKNDEPNLFGY